MCRVAVLLVLCLSSYIIVFSFTYFFFFKYQYYIYSSHYDALNSSLSLTRIYKYCPLCCLYALLCLYMCLCSFSYGRSYIALECYKKSWIEIFKTFIYRGGSYKYEWVFFFFGTSDFFPIVYVRRCTICSVLQFFFIKTSTKFSDFQGL